MKRFAWLFIIGLLAAPLSLPARHMDARMEIRMYNRAPIRVWIDGHKANHEPAARVIISRLEPGRHFFRIVRYSPIPRFYGSRVVYKGYVFVRPGTMVEAVVGLDYRMEVYQRRIRRTKHHESKGYHKYGRHHEDEKWEHNYRDDDYEGYGYFDDEYPDDYDYRGRSQMSAGEFNELKRMLQEESFDSDRLRLAKQALENRWVTSRQVKKIMELFVFEQNRLAFAKYAYDYVLDKERYYIVNDTFTFESSASELDRYLRDR